MEVLRIKHWREWKIEREKMRWEDLPIENQDEEDADLHIVS